MHIFRNMITRRAFVGFATSSLVFLPVLGCLSTEDDIDVSWFLSETEIMAVGQTYYQKAFSSIDESTLLINGWILTAAEAEVCKKKYIERA